MCLMILPMLPIHGSSSIRRRKRRRKATVIVVVAVDAVPIDGIVIKTKRQWILLMEQ